MNNNPYNIPIELNTINCNKDSICHDKYEDNNIKVYSRYVGIDCYGILIIKVMIRHGK